jgi:hypothetical protein
LDLAEAREVGKRLVQALAQRYAAQARNREVARLFSMTQAARDGRLTPRAYYAQLIEEAQAAGVHVGSAGQLEAYLRYLERMEEVDRSELFGELEGFSWRVLEALAGSPLEREFLGVERRLDELDRLTRMKWTPSEYEAYLEGRRTGGGTSLSDCVRFIREQARRLGLTFVRPQGVAAWEAYRPVLERFYEIARLQTT